MLFAQAVNFDIPALITSVGVGGILVWYLYYRTAVADPAQQKAWDERSDRQQEAFEERLDALTIRHNDTIRAITTEFTQALNEERNFRRTDMGTLKVYLQRLSDDNVKKSSS